MRLVTDKRVTPPVQTIRQLDTLQAGRALAAISILLFHTNVTLNLSEYLGRNVFPLVDAAYFSVFFFFVLSGFIIYLAHADDIGNIDQVGPYLWKRVRRIYPPLWATLLVIVPLYFIAANHRAAAASAASVVSDFLASPTPDNHILGVEWTLRHEVIFYTVFALWISNRIIGGAVMAIWILLSAAPWGGGPYILKFLFLPYHMLFGVGMLAAQCYRRSPRLPGSVTLLVGSVAMAGAVAASYLAGYRGPAPHANPYGEAAFGIGAALLIHGAASLERRRSILVPRALAFLGEASYSIYLIHFPAVSLASKAAVRLGKYLPDAVIFSIVASTALGLGILFHVAIERPMIKRLSPSPPGREAGPARTVSTGALSS